MDICSSPFPVFFVLIYARESPPLPQEGGSHGAFCNWCWSFFSRRWREREHHFCWFVQLSRTPLIITKERDRSWPICFFILLVFVLGNRFQGKGFEFIDSFVWVLIAFIYNWLVDYFVFIYTFSVVWANLRAYLRLFFVYSWFI